MRAMPEIRALPLPSPAMWHWLRRGFAVPFALILVLSSGVGWVVQGQEQLDLEPLEDERFAIRSLVPAGWTTLEPGVYARLADEMDRTIIVLRSIPQDPQAVWETLLPQLDLAEPPEPVGARSTTALD